MRGTPMKQGVALFAAVCLTAFYASGLYADAPLAAGGFWSCLAAAAVILLNSALLSFTNTRISAHSNIYVSFVYIALVAVNPYALRWTLAHPASLFLLISIILYLAYCAEKPSMEYLSGAFFMLGTSGLLLPQLLWLFPILLLSSIGKSEDKLKYIVTAIISLLLPMLIFGGICYIRHGIDDTLAAFSGMWEKMSGISMQDFRLSAASLCRILLAVIATVTAFVYIVRHLTVYKTVQFLAYIRILVLTLAICLIALLFNEDGLVPYELIISIPITLLLGEYFINSGDRRGKNILIAILILMFIAERISLFL